MMIIYQQGESKWPHHPVTAISLNKMQQTAKSLDLRRGDDNVEKLFRETETRCLQ